MLNPVKTHAFQSLLGTVNMLFSLRVSVARPICSLVSPLLRPSSRISSSWTSSSSWMPRDLCPTPLCVHGSCINFHRGVRAAMGRGQRRDGREYMHSNGQGTWWTNTSICLVRVALFGICQMELLLSQEALEFRG